MATRGKQFDVPDEIELLEFFGVDPIERSIEDGYWCYEIEDERGVRLRLSFNIYERSVQTMLSSAGGVVATVSHEGADRMLLRDGKVRCEFSLADSRASLAIEIGRSLSVVWSTLRVQ